jgi:hypothetical protein
MANPNPDTVVVYETGDLMKLQIARSLLEEEEIDCTTRGEGLQDLFAAGRAGTGFSPIAGPAQLIVRRADAARAEELLRELDQPSEESEENDLPEEDPPDGRPS